VGGQQDAVTAWRLTQSIHLFAERQQLLTGLFEGVHQLGVARREGVDSRLELMDIPGTAETAVRTYRLLELLAQRGGFAAELLQFGSVIAGHGLWLTHIAPLPAPKIGAVTTSTLPAIQSSCAL
jgi:hypothetical protein